MRIALLLMPRSLSASRVSLKTAAGAILTRALRRGNQGETHQIVGNVEREFFDASDAEAFWKSMITLPPAYDSTGRGPTNLRNQNRMRATSSTPLVADERSFRRARIAR